MRISRSSKSLFWLNFIAAIQTALGLFLVLIGLFLFFIKEFLISLVPFGLSIFFLIRGRIARLDYERKSGYIVYGK